jgi:formate hydrogenlyase subunit 3/multisubunit Na+/H+ antiporter MnhD subunit
MIPLSLGITEYTLLFLFLTVPPYIASFIYALKYIHSRKAEFFTFFLLTFFGNVLIYFTKNFFTLLIVYEFVSLVSFPLILHERIKKSLTAAKLYFMFSLLSGVLVLGGIWLVQMPTYQVLGALMMGLGFLVKAGGFPFHVWLPEAHPVAPSPASAILSGCIIKIGFYGMIQAFVLVRVPALYGYLLFGISLITMFFGVIQALLQSNAKRMLAFHSISQMGYILMGLSLYLIFRNTDALAASILHAVNHAWFKSALFLTTGVMAMYFGTLDMYAMRGLLKKKWLVALLFLVAVMGISGVPFTNGFISKNALHEELVLHQSALFVFAETIFLLTAVGTLTSNFKMFYLSSFRSMKERFHLRFDWREVIPLGLLAVLIIAFGSNPALYNILLPHQFHSFSHVLESLTLHHHGFIHSLAGFFWIFLAGIMLIFVGLKKGWFHLQIPYTWTVLSWWYHLYEFLMKMCTSWCQKIEDSIVHRYDGWIAYIASPWFHSCQEIAIMFPKQSLPSCKRLTTSCSSFDCKMDHLTCSIVPGTKSWTHLTSEKICKIDDRLCHFWHQVKSVFLALMDKSDKEDQRNAKHYAFMVTKVGKIVIIVTILLTIGGFILFVIGI